MNETSYDQVQYPANLYSTTHPSHLAAIARLHGLDAPDPATARVLEIAGGDGVNLIAMAAAYPDATFLSFDISSVAVERGARIAAAAGLTNVRIEVGDVMVAAEEMDGDYDYIIVHGLYAWVPEPVRKATLRLIGRLLSATGVAMVSYNAAPGGHLRIAIREMVLHEVEHITDPAERVERAQAVLADFAAPREGDRGTVRGMREVAMPMTRKHVGTLYHDELGDCYFPHAFKDVVAAAAPHGLAFLNDALPQMMFDGLPGAGMRDEEVVRAAQSSDYQAVAFFHQTLFIRPGRNPARHVDPANIARLFATTKARRTGPETFTLNDATIEVADAKLANFLEALSVAAPMRLSLAPFGDAPEYCEALMQLCYREVVELHAAPYPGARQSGDTPVASPLVRRQIDMGVPIVFTLDHQTIGMSEPGPRAFLSLLDGTRDRETLERDWQETEFAAQVSVEDALTQLAKAGLMLR